MMWDGVGDFLAMGGHWPWVWGSYGVAVLLVLAESILVARRRRRVTAMLRRRAHAGSVAHPVGGGEHE